MNNNNMEREIHDIFVEDIIPNRFQPRLTFDENALNELAESIKIHGIIQPLVVRKVGDKYEIIAGERRYKAAQIVGLIKVPAVIMNLDDKQSAEVAVVENIQRKELSALEEAESYRKLLDKGYLTQDQLGTRMGKTQPTISNKLRLLGLSEEVKDALLNQKISERHARSLLNLKNSSQQKEVLDNIINNRLNVRDTDNLVKSMLDNNEQKEELFMEIPNINPSVNEQQKEVEAIPFDIPFNPSMINVEPITQPISNPFNQNNEVVNPVETTPFIDRVDNDSYISPTINIAEPFNPGMINVEPITQPISNPFIQNNEVVNPVETTPLTSPTINIDEPFNPAMINFESIAKPMETNVNEEDKNIINSLQIENMATIPTDINFTPISNFDINKLKEEAADINETDEPVDIGSLLRDPNKPEEETEEKPENKKRFFFDFFDRDDNEEEKPVKEENTINEPKVNDNINVIEQPMQNNINVTEFQRNDNKEEKPIQNDITIPEYQQNDQIINANNIENNDLKSAINIMRKMVKILEDKGFNIQLEEFDFERMYQIIVKINK